MSISTYTYLPWLRRGISNEVLTPAGTSAVRASVSIGLAVTSDVARSDIPPVTVSLVGPGDITGLDSRQIIRTEPRAGVSDFEPNYLAAVDLYAEDFPWRYSPLAPEGATHRLTPWIALVVLEEREFVRTHSPDRPLPSFALTPSARAADIFPALGQEWAWAHAHVNLAVAGAPAAPDLAQLGSTLDVNPDSGCARLLCPRRLTPNTGYTAFVVPVFETGRKAGLGEPIGDPDDGLARSWQEPEAEFPIYFEWSFRTGVEGDFESLVRALVPRDMDPRVGVRDLNIARPGFGIDAASNPPDDMVGLEGALLAPTTTRKGLAEASDVVAKLQRVLNAPAHARDSGVGDPLVAPPLYGCWHGRTDRVGSTLVDVGWVDGLNLDPRYRAAAGLGARVIRAEQERYMQTAWEQIGDVVTVNRRIRYAQLATKAASAAYVRSFAPLPAAQVVTMAAPVFSKVLGSRTTLAGLVKASRLPQAAMSRAFQKQVRPRGRIFRRFFAGDTRARMLARLVVDFNVGRLSAAPARLPAGGATVEAINDAVSRPRRRTRAVEAAPLLSSAALAPKAIASTPARSKLSFAGAATDATANVSRTRSSRPIVRGDNPTANDMRQALIEFGAALAVNVAPAPPKPSANLDMIHAKTLAALEPHRAFSLRFAPLFRVGPIDALAYTQQYYLNGGAFSEPGTLQEVMNYPDIKDAMYAPLQQISSEYFLPNLHLIPNNTLSLLRTNQPFIEAYLAGLNHEFARELLWREYPTDQRGSPFRQFWDVSTYVDREQRTPRELAAFLKDVPPLHRWADGSALGSHDRRQADPARKAAIVLVIRGDLLKRYPNTFIYAQRAMWGTGARADRLVLSDETGELFASAPGDQRLRFPLYKARIAPDLHFIGFDLTLDEARGDPRLEETAAARTIVCNNLGWFFVIQEAVGEPRFGLDVNPPTEPSAEKWDNLAWVNLDMSNGPLIDVEKPFVSQPVGANPSGVEWSSNAADLAYALYQDPVMVTVHGRNMLKTLTPDQP